MLLHLPPEIGYLRICIYPTSSVPLSLCPCTLPLHLSPTSSLNNQNFAPILFLSPTTYYSALVPLSWTNVLSNLAFIKPYGLNECSLYAHPTSVNPSGYIFRRAKDKWDCSACSHACPHCVVKAAISAQRDGSWHASVVHEWADWQMQVTENTRLPCMETKTGFQADGNWGYLRSASSQPQRVFGRTAQSASEVLE